MGVALAVPPRRGVGLPMRHCAVPRPQQGAPAGPSLRRDPEGKVVLQLPRNSAPNLRHPQAILEQRAARAFAASRVYLNSRSTTLGGGLLAAVVDTATAERATRLIMDVLTAMLILASHRLPSCGLP